ncbi:MAG: class I SAM-dependent methyltransferase, partial [Clostridiales bacterium]
MKVRDSGMPEESYWESLFDVNLILSKLEINNNVNNLVEFGSGYGTFSIPASKIIKGTLYAIDMDPVMIERLYLRAKEENVKNIKIIEEDFVKERTILADNSVDYAMLFNILHAEDPVELLKEAKRILRPGGKAGVIH